MGPKRLSPTPRYWEMGLRMSASETPLRFERRLAGTCIPLGSSLSNHQGPTVSETKEYENSWGGAFVSGFFT